MSDQSSFNLDDVFKRHKTYQDQENRKNFEKANNEHLKLFDYFRKEIMTNLEKDPPCMFIKHTNAPIPHVEYALIDAYLYKEKLVSLPYATGNLKDKILSKVISEVCVLLSEGFNSKLKLKNIHLDYFELEFM